MLCMAAGGKMLGQTAGDCGGSHANINTIAVSNRFQEYFQMTLVHFRKGVGGPRF